MSYLDPADSRFHVDVDKAYPEVAEALRARLGDRADVTLGSPSRLAAVTTDHRTRAAL